MKRVEEEKASELNMTPMIDIVFQLLIFFMLSMHFKEVEGRLLSTLPKKSGLESSLAPVRLEEVRIVLCAGGDARTHLTDKGRHEAAAKDGRVCRAAVEKVDIGELRRTEDAADAREGNRAVYRAAARRARELVEALRTDRSKPAPVILDGDSEVAYEHVLGIVNACREAGIANVEFVGNPRFARYFGK
jgi:biopolymer transport protein ExbD